MSLKNWLLGMCFFCALWPLSTSGEVTNVKEAAKKVDIILLQDESGSMVTTDPQHIRSHVATYLIEDMEVAGEGNRMSLVLFGSRAEEKVGLSRDFKRIRETSQEGFPPRKGQFDRTSRDRVPARGYTDIYGALEAALRMLKQEPSGEKGAAAQTDAEKHVILLTDGRIDPWPGNEERYGSVASDYLQCVRQSGHTRCDARFKSRVEAMDKEALLDSSGLLAEFRKNGWRVHCVGFSQGIDLDLMNQIAAATYGNAGMAADYTQLLGILEQIIPPAPNVITLLVKDFCKTRRVEESVQIDSDIKAVQFKVDLNAMLAQKTSIRPENLKILLTAPNETEIRSEDGKFRFNTTKEGLAVTATYFQERPEPGVWRIVVEGVGADICGKIGVTGRVPFVPEMDLTPEISDYYGGQGIGVNVFLKNRESNQHVPVKSVEGRFRFAPEGGGNIREESIKFEVKDGHAGESVDFRVPEGIKGTAAIETTVTDAKYGSRMKQFRKINVEPSPGEAEITADPARMSLGVVGDDACEITSDPITLSTLSHVPVEVMVKKPKLSSGAHEINILWVTVTPASGTISAGKPLKIRVQVAFPKDASLSLPRGLYTGDMEVSAKNMKGECIIPLDLEVAVPEILVEPPRLTTDFWFRLGAPMAQSIQVGHTSNRDRLVRVELPGFFKDSRGKYEKNISVAVPNTDVLEWSVDRGDMVEIPLEVSLTNLSLNKAQRIPKGTYKGIVVITGEGLSPKEVEIRVAVPETPAVVTYGRPLSLILTGIFCLLTLIGLAFFINRSTTRVFKRGKYRIGFDRDGRMKRKMKKRFECVFEKGRDEDGEDVFSMPAEGNREIQVEDPSSGEMVPFPDHGISNITDWKGAPLKAIQTGRYKYKSPEPKGKKLAMRVAASPYGTAAGYFFKKVVVWLIFGIAAAGAAYWFHQIV
jgi:hypothetical protein